MKVEAEDFRIPVPPTSEPSEPSSPAKPLTILQVKESKNSNGGEVHLWGAWKVAGHGRNLCGPQAIELTLTAVALCCWTTMCVLDLSGWNGDDSGASQILSLSILMVSCIAFATRHCCMAILKDPDGRRGLSRLQHQLLIVLASQWSLLLGAIIWLVFHASSERHPQVVAGLVAVSILLILLVCSLVYMLLVRTRGALDAPKELLSGHVARTSHHSSEDLALASVDHNGDWTPDRSCASSAKPQGLEVATRPEDSDDGMSDNYVGHVLSTSPKSGRSSQRSTFPLKVRVESAEDIEEIEKQFSEECVRKQKSVEFEKEILRSSRGKWRPLFPTFMASSLNAMTSPTMSRNSMSSAGEVMRRGTSIHSTRYSFRFETEEEVEQSLAKECKRHTLEVNATLLRSTSPSPSLGSLPSQQSDGKKVKSSRGSSSSGLSDDSGDKRSSGSGLA